jgi:nitrous oxidase accessory protein NosD
MARRGDGIEICGILDNGSVCVIAVAYTLHLDCRTTYLLLAYLLCYNGRETKLGENKFQHNMVGVSLTKRAVNVSEK